MGGSASKPMNSAAKGSILKGAYRRVEISLDDSPENQGIHYVKKMSK
jgi:hypothetical protein